MPDAQHNVYFARQPVFDSAMGIVSWELLYRASPDDSSMRADPQEATAKLLIHMLYDFDLRPMLEGKPAFINFPPGLLTDLPDFDPARYIIEVDAQDPAAGELLEPINQLWAKGYRISLDNYVPESPLAAIAQRMPFVRLDVRSLTRGQLSAAIASLGRYHGQIIAERIESHEELEFCRDAGVHLFQGNFLKKPQLEESGRVPESKLVVMRLLQEVRAPDLSIAALQKTLAQDPTLSFRLLSLVNSAQFRRAAEIRSIQHALTVLGVDKLQTWVTMLALCNLSDKPTALQISALHRARMAESLAECLQMEDTDLMFTAGLFSLLDAFFDRPLPELIEKIQLTGPLRTALESTASLEGTLLRFVIDYEETCHFEPTLWEALRGRGITPQHVGDAYMEATRWSLEVVRELLRD